MAICRIVLWDLDKAFQMGSKAWAEPCPRGGFSKKQGSGGAFRALKWENAGVKQAKVGQILL